MKTIKKDKTESGSNKTKTSKKPPGADPSGPSSNKNEKHEKKEQGSYTFQRNESDDKNKLAPREEL